MMLFCVSYYRFHQYKEVQRQVLIKQVNIAKQLNKPIVIHCRDAEEDCLEILAAVSHVICRFADTCILVLSIRRLPNNAVALVTQILVQFAN